MSETNEVTAAVLIVGNEILSGRTKDANLAYIGEGLTEIGVRLCEARVVRDVEEEVIEAVRVLSDRYDVLFTTGGIGPTHDDITCECVAKAFGVPVVQNPEAAKVLSEWFESRGIEANGARMRMANTPEGATLIENEVSKAPGFTIQNVHVMAGIPRVMQSMFDAIKPTLRRGAKMLSRSIECNVGEGTVATGLSDLQDRYPGFELGSYPFSRDGKFGTVLVARGTDAGTLETIAGEISQMVRDLGGNPVEVDVQ